MLAHLGHPLVDMSARLLRAAVWSGHTGLHRVTAVVSDDPALEHTLAGAYSRFVLVGADGIRLHEEILYAGGWLRDDGTFRRVESLGELAGMLDRALSQGTPAAPVIQDRLAAQWPRARDRLLAAIERRTDERLSSLQAKLAARQADERRRITTSSTRFAASLAQGAGRRRGRGGRAVQRGRRTRRRAGDGPVPPRPGELAGKAPQPGCRRVTASSSGSPPATARSRPHSFPVAVIFVVPRREAIR